MWQELVRDGAHKDRLRSNPACSFATNRLIPSHYIH